MDKAKSNVLDHPDGKALVEGSGQDEAAGDAADTAPSKTSSVVDAGHYSSVSFTSEGARPASAEDLAFPAGGSGSPIKDPATAGTDVPTLRPAAGPHINGDDPANTSAKELEGQDNSQEGQLVVGDQVASHRPPAER